MSISTSRRHSLTVTRAAVGQACRIEPLEGRVLLSATWGTVNDQSVSTLNVPFFNLHKMAVDPAGNVYVVGEYNLPGTPAYHGVALRKAAGSATWTKILDVGGVSNGSVSHFD